MRRKLATRSVLGVPPALALLIVAAALATAALQDTGFDQWWVLPAALVALLGLGSARRDR